MIVCTQAGEILVCYVRSSDMRHESFSFRFIIVIDIVHVIGVQFVSQAQISTKNENKNTRHNRQLPGQRCQPLPTLAESPLIRAVPVSKSTHNRKDRSNRNPNQTNINIQAEVKIKL